MIIIIILLLLLLYILDGTVAVSAIKIINYDRQEDEGRRYTGAETGS